MTSVRRKKIWIALKVYTYISVTWHHNSDYLRYNKKWAAYLHSSVDRRIETFFNSFLKKCFYENCGETFCSNPLWLVFIIYYFFWVVLTLYLYSVSYFYNDYDFFMMIPSILIYLCYFVDRLNIYHQLNISFYAN